MIAYTQIEGGKHTGFCRSSLYGDMACLLLIISVNPIIYLFNCSPRIFSPDSIAYITMGRDMFHDGLLYIPSWGNVNQGLIYPPLYPFFIAIGQFFSNDGLKVAEWVSSICAILSAVPMYLFLKSLSNRLISVVTLFLIQINYYYFLFGMKPLSEATFLLTLSWFLLLTLKFLHNPVQGGKRLPIFIGMVSALVFFSRQLGLAVLLVFSSMTVFQLLLNKADRPTTVYNFLLFCLGCLIFLVPYAGAVYWQTGQLPLKQHFVMGNQNKTKPDFAVAEEIAKIKSLTLSDVKLLENQANPEYGLMYAKRRFLQKLTPDASEMLSDVVVSGKRRPLLARVVLWVLKNPKNYISSVYNNFKSLSEPLGAAVLWAFVISCFCPLVVRYRKEDLLRRLFLPCFIVIYIICISCFGDRIPRYAYVIFPFMVIQVASEFFYLMKFIDEFKKLRYSTLIWTFAFLGLLALTPKTFTSSRLSPKLEIEKNDILNIKNHVRREAVFTLFPVYSYLAGGSYRVLPNDSLEKIVAYGKNTGVKWILVPFTQCSKSEMKFYLNAKWYWNHSLDQDYRGLIQYCCSCRTPDGKLVLYRIL